MNKSYFYQKSVSIITRVTENSINYNTETLAANNCDITVLPLKNRLHNFCTNKNSRILIFLFCSTFKIFSAANFSKIRGRIIPRLYEY